MKYKIEVEIKNIEVEGFIYSFDYIVTIDGKEVESDTYENDHSWDEPAQFEEELKKGYALELVLEGLHE